MKGKNHARETPKLFTVNLAKGEIYMMREFTTNEWIKQVGDILQNHNTNHGSLLSIDPCQPSYESPFN